MAPRRGVPYGGIEFDPADARRLLIVGDETAVPAVCGILRDLPADAVGAAYVEVPVSGDVLHVTAPPGVTVTWLPRNGAPLGERLAAAVLDHLGDPLPPAEVADDEVDPDLWETPVYSSATESAPAEQAPETEGCLDDLYAWIAGESKVVTGLRRNLVNDLGMHATPRRLHGVLATRRLDAVLMGRVLKWLPGRPLRPRPIGELRPPARGRRWPWRARRRRRRGTRPTPRRPRRWPPRS